MILKINVIYLMRNVSRHRLTQTICTHTHMSMNTPYANVLKNVET